MKIKEYHTVRTDPKSNRYTVWTESKSIRLGYMTAHRVNSVDVKKAEPW